MNKTLKIFMILLIILMAVVEPVMATETKMSNFPTGDISGSTTVKEGMAKIWRTGTTIVQVLAFGAVVFAGLRYMFASADHKADIKKSLGMLAIGAILVFAASTVVKFVVGVANQVI